MTARATTLAALALAFLFFPEGIAHAQDLLEAGAPVAEEAVDEGRRGSGRAAGWVLVALIAVGGLALRLVLRQAATTLIYLGGFALIFAGERLWPESVVHWPLTGLGLVAVFAALGLLAREMFRATDPDRRHAHRQALTWGLVGAASLLLYSLTQDSMVGRLGLDEDAQARWSGVLHALMPILWLLGTLPLVLVDRLLTAHPLALPPRSVQRARDTGLATALALALVFPLNYLAGQHDWRHDTAYFRTTDVGTSTRALAQTLSDPITVYAFFPPGSDVRQQVEPYLHALAEAGDGMIVVEWLDQALAPQLAEELRVRENGTVAFVRGETVERLNLGMDLDRARTRLRRLDGSVQQHLLSLAKGERVAYLLVGDGEASPRERDEPLRKLNVFKQLLDSQNYVVRNFGVTEGSADAVPEDAEVVIVPAPMEPLLPEEERTLIEYIDDGGRLFLMVEPDGDPLTAVLGHLGVRAESSALAHATAHVRQTRGIGDRVTLVSNRFGSHEAVTTLSRNSTQLAVVTPTVTPIEKTGEGSGRVTTLIRSLPDTWLDIDGDRMRGDDEPAKVWDLAVAIEGPGDDGYRAVVIGDVNAFSDPILQFSQGNAVFAVDTLRWLADEASLAGESETEEDVRIQHTRDQDIAWFWGTIFGVPAMVFLTGLIFVNVRRRR